MKKLAWMVATVALAVFLAAPADAQSSKAAWRFEELVSLPAACAAAGQEPSCDEPTTDTGFVDILTTHIKTPNAKELALGVSLQCGLVTDTTVKSKNGDLDSSAARGRIRVRVEITQPDGTVVYGQPDNGADLDTDIPLANSGNPDGLTYCDRYQKLAAKFAGLNCTAATEAVEGTCGANGFCTAGEVGASCTVDDDCNLSVGEVTCLDPEELQLILKTLNAHHFNFIHANATPGVHKVVVQARAQAGILLGGTRLGAAGAEAFAGAGALSVETIRLVKDADGTTDLTDLK